MKRTILSLTLMLGCLLLALSVINSSGGIRANTQSDQNDNRKAEPSEQAKREEKTAFDIDGKRLRADEKYVAERELANGRIIAYRKNRREVAALVKALKEDGVTDEKLLDPKTWMMNRCDRTLATGCIGGCGQFRPCIYSPIKYTDTQRHPSDNSAILMGSCVCG